MWRVPPAQLSDECHMGSVTQGESNTRGVTRGESSTWGVLCVGSGMRGECHAAGWHQRDRPIAGSGECRLIE